MEITEAQLMDKVRTYDGYFRKDRVPVFLESRINDMVYELNSIVFGRCCTEVQSSIKNVFYYLGTARATLMRRYAESFKLKIDRDLNGNKVVRVNSLYFGSKFSIKTLGNLPGIHTNYIVGQKEFGNTYFMLTEINNYVYRYGTDRQRKLMGF